MYSVEGNLESVQQLRNDVDCLLTTTAELASQVKSLASQCENLEGQSRRTKLIFMGYLTVMKRLGLPVKVRSFRFARLSWYEV